MIESIGSIESLSFPLLSDALYAPAASLFLSRFILVLASLWLLGSLAADCFALASAAQRRLRPESTTIGAGLWFWRQAHAEARCPEALQASVAVRAFIAAALATIFACTFELLNAPGSPEETGLAGLAPLLASVLALALAVAAVRFPYGGWASRAHELLTDPEFERKAADRDACERAFDEALEIEADSERAPGAKRSTRRL